MATLLASSTLAAMRTVSPNDANVLAVGVTTTAAGTCDTVTVAVADTAPAVAVTVVDPLATEVTNPVASTVTTASSAEAHVTEGLAIVWLRASVTASTSRSVSVSATSVSLAGVTEMEIGTCATVTAAVSATEPEVAIIEAAPLPVEVTKPVESTVATSVSADIHATLGVASGWFCASTTSATSRVVSPRDTSVSLAGVSVTVAASCATSKVAVPAMPSTVAVMATVPLSTAVANPAALTVATVVSDEVQVKVFPEMDPPLALAAVAANCPVSPSAFSVSTAGVTCTVTTTRVGSGPVVELPPESLQAATSVTEQAKNKALVRGRMSMEQVGRRCIEVSKGTLTLCAHTAIGYPGIEWPRNPWISCFVARTLSRPLFFFGGLR